VAFRASLVKGNEDFLRLESTQPKKNEVISGRTQKSMRSSRLRQTERREKCWKTE